MSIMCELTNEKTVRSVSANQKLYLPDNDLTLTNEKTDVSQSESSYLSREWMKLGGNPFLFLIELTFTSSLFFFLDQRPRFNSGPSFQSFLLTPGCGLRNRKQNYYLLSTLL